MNFVLAIKEKIARVIGEYFTTNQIVNVFTDANIPTDESLFAKWKIVLDAFGKMSNPREEIQRVLEVFAHPLNFTDPDIRREFVKKLNVVLAYDKMEMYTTATNAYVNDDSQKVPEVPWTVRDFVIDVITLFKKEYNNLQLLGLTYEYSLGEGPVGEYEERDYNKRLKAIQQLKDIGLVTSFDIESREGRYGDHYPYAVCKIDESKLTQRDVLQTTTTSLETIAQKVVHEHTHRFENSIQEKGIDLNHKFDEQKSSGFYITKKDDDFWYKGRCLNLSKNTDYHKVFAALYAKLPEGGEISYKELAIEIESRLFKARGKTTDEMRKFIQRNLTDRNNGFVRYASIPETEDNGKPLIEVVRNTGVRFNNKTG